MADKRVLLVHDDATFVDQVKQAASASGYDFEIATALSGPRALGMVNNQRPDVIAVDAELVGMDGYAVTQEIKSKPETADIPVIILSLQPTEASALKARQAGAAAHMPSTGPVDQLVVRLADLSGAGQAETVAAPAPGDDGSAVPAAAPEAATAPASVQPSAGAAGDVYGAPQPVQASAGAPDPVGYGVPQPAPSPASAPSPPPPETAVGVRPAPHMGLGDNMASDNSGDVPHIDDLLRLMIDRGGSDLHITVGSPPGLRLRGDIVPVENFKVLSPRDTVEMILNLLSEEQRRKFETELELDFAYSIPGVSRFRANVFQQRNSMGAVFRVIPIAIPTLEDLALPKICRFLAERPRGLVLVTGPTGSGKSTTLATMVDWMNTNLSRHIITIEDPVEFRHSHKRSFVTQREVGTDTPTFAEAMRRALRQDPDVLLVGEMRDLETMSAAVTAAETGHLVLATLHTTGSAKTINRIIDAFPSNQQAQIRVQLALSLLSVISQVLVPTSGGNASKGSASVPARISALEVMIMTPAIANMIRNSEVNKIPDVMQTNRQLGMFTLDSHLAMLYQQGLIGRGDALAFAQDPGNLDRLLS